MYYVSQVNTQLKHSMLLLLSVLLSFLLMFFFIVFAFFFICVRGDLHKKTGKRMTLCIFQITPTLLA